MATVLQDVMLARARGLAEGRFARPPHVETWPRWPAAAAGVLTHGACTYYPLRLTPPSAPRSRFPLTNPVVRSRLRASSASRQRRDLRKSVRRVGIEPTTRWLGVV